MRHTVNAILTVGDGYLLQLRDDIPGLADAGMWGTFGGQVDDGEDRATALTREVFEETNLLVESPRLLGTITIVSAPIQPSSTTHHIYHADVSDQFHLFRCNEGQRGEIFSVGSLPTLPMSKGTRDFLYLHEYEKIRKEHTVVMCHGVFDALHYGHLLHFNAAKKHGDFLIVSLVADRFVNKGHGRPLFTEDQREAILSALRIVDKVVITDSIDWWVSHISCFKPDFYAKGGDYVARQPPECAAVESYGGKVIFTPPTSFSSSAIIKAIGK